MAMTDLNKSTYTGEFGFLIVEPAAGDPGSYDREELLAAHHWDGHWVSLQDIKKGPPPDNDQAGAFRPHQRRRPQTACRVYAVLHHHVPAACRARGCRFLSDTEGRGLVNEYDSMAEEFEKEHEQFGEDGFERMVARVAQLEQQMGIHDLDQFTPR
jgi:hypothetical protein